MTAAVVGAWVDSHCHLDRLVLDPYDGDLSGALSAARARGVRHFLNISIELETFPTVRAIAEAHDDVYCTVGVHPCHTASHQPTVEELMALAQHPKVLGIGETGLDFFHDASTRAAQEALFDVHMTVARALDKPLIIHTRESRDAVLAQMKARGAERAVMHCFTEDWATAVKALDLGYYISLSGIVTFKKAEQVHEVARKVPLDRLLVETDAPYLAPTPHRGKPNEPAFVVHTGQAIAQLRGLTPEALAEATTANYERLFRVHTGPASPLS